MCPPSTVAICVRPLAHCRARRTSSGHLTATVGIFIFHPSVPNYPKAKFPGVVVFSEIYQGETFKFLLQISHTHLLSPGISYFIAAFGIPY